MPIITMVARRVRRVHALRGYHEFASEVKQITDALRHGEIDRDGGDLLIRGRLHGSPTFVRLSHSETQPGLNIRVPFPLPLSIYCVPKEMDDSTGGSVLRTGDTRFDSRFRIRADEPQMARLLLGNHVSIAAIQGLCCSSRTFVVIHNYHTEIRELLIPEQDLASHVLRHLKEGADLIAVARQLPGAKERDDGIAWPRWSRLAPYAVAAILLMAALLILPRNNQSPGTVTAQRSAPEIPHGDASKIPDLQNWQVMQADDFDSNGQGWLHQQGQTPEGRITGPFSGDAASDSAYLLKASAPASPQARRLVMFVDGEVRYDATLPTIALAARIPKAALSQIEWRGKHPIGEPAGDGVLVVRKYDDPGSGMVLFLSGIQIIVGFPQDFRDISLD